METPLRRARRRSGQTLREVADAVGTDPSNLSRIETAKQRATAELAELLAKRFKISEAKILYPERYIENPPEAA